MGYVARKWQGLWSELCFVDDALAGSVRIAQYACVGVSAGLILLGDDDAC